MFPMECLVQLTWCSCLLMSVFVYIICAWTCLCNGRKSVAVICKRVTFYGEVENCQPYLLLCSACWAQPSSKCTHLFALFQSPGPFSRTEIDLLNINEWMYALLTEIPSNSWWSFYFYFFIFSVLVKLWVIAWNEFASNTTSLWY